MRQYLVYVKGDKNRTQSYITPCFAVDQLFWAEQERRDLYVIGQSASLALAFAIREKINRYLQTKPFSNDALDEIKSIAGGYVREANHLYGKQTEESLGKQRQPWFTLAGDRDRLAAEDERDHSLTQTGTSAATWSTMNREADLVHSLIVGRALLWDELERLVGRIPQLCSDLQALLQLLVLRGVLVWAPGIRLSVQKGLIRNRLLFVCARCGSDSDIHYSVCHTCNQGCAYCVACLGMGRSRCCTPYLCAPVRMPLHSEASQPYLQWEGKLSPYQAFAAEQARQFTLHREPVPAFLIWAVCGAGKTELVFPAINAALMQGGQVLLATPRKDVVLELVPRLKRAFPTVKVLAVHGSSKEKWDDGQLILATTHQVLRYYRRFALVIVDEVDAFPYHGDKMLYRSVARAVAEGGKLLYLSATPPDYLKRSLVKKRGFQYASSSSTHVMLPRRFHGHPLPVPSIIIESELNKRLKQKRSLPRVLGAINESFERQRQVFVFVPRIEDVETTLAYLQMHLPAYAERMLGVHAADPQREEKVVQFREKEALLIVTTTILERGVTIPRSDVIVLGADAAVFDEASLVQIAGRVGRSADSPDGMILFVLSQRTNAASAAIKQIKTMNQLAKSLSVEHSDHAS